MNRTIEIHSWGGFGSQLFALALILDLEARLQGTFSLICHSSGVTKRLPEIDSFLNRYKVISIDDFQSSESGEVVKYKLAKRKKVVDFRKLALFSGLIAECNTDSQFAQIRPWIRQFRGHYSYRTITPKTLHSMNKVLVPTSPFTLLTSTYNPSTLSLHYRLGDLQSLSNKTYIESQRINSIIDHSIRENSIQTLLLSSDSPSEATQKIDFLNSESYELIQLQGDSLALISQLQSSQIFIGTNSKISLWVAIIRATFPREDYVTWMPFEMRSHLEANLYIALSSGRINYY